MSRSSLIALAAVVTMAATVPAWAGVEAVRGSIYQFVYASDDYNTPSGNVVDASFYADSWTGMAETLVADRMAYAAGTATDGPDAPASWVRTTAGIDAVWHSASSGAVDFTNIGWVSSNSTSGYADLSAVQTNPSEWADRSWSYTFVPDVDSLFVLDYSLLAAPGTSDPFGISRFRFSCYQVDGCEGVENQTVLAVGDSGRLSFAVQAGQEASFYLDVWGVISGALGTRTTLMNAEFDWKVTPVPEPRPYAMLLAGMALVAVRVARGRRATTLAR